METLPPGIQKSIKFSNFESIHFHDFTADCQNTSNFYYSSVVLSNFTSKTYTAMTSGFFNISVDMLLEDNNIGIDKCQLE